MHPFHTEPSGRYDKLNASKGLDILMKANKLSLNPKSWIERRLLQLYTKGQSTKEFDVMKERRKTRLDPLSYRPT